MAAVATTEPIPNCPARHAWTYNRTSTEFGKTRVEELTEYLENLLPYLLKNKSARDIFEKNMGIFPHRFVRSGDLESLQTVMALALSLNNAPPLDIDTNREENTTDANTTEKAAADVASMYVYSRRNSKISTKYGALLGKNIFHSGI